jgi:predicted metal-dependent phosphoesterase TrpH
MFPNGSEWRKSDLHVHSPASNGFSDTWDQFKDQLKNADCDVIGINNYFSVAGYKQTKEKIESERILVESARKLIEIYERKTKDTIAKH